MEKRSQVQMLRKRIFWALNENLTNDSNCMGPNRTEYLVFTWRLGTRINISLTTLSLATELAYEP